MEQTQFQSGLNARSADPLKGIPEEEMEGQCRAPTGGESDQHVDEGHGHGKKSMLNKMKDKAKTLKTKVKNKITPHHGSHDEDYEESQEDSNDTTSEEEEGKYVEERYQTGDRTVKDIDENARGEYKNAEDNFQTGEANKSSLGLGKVQQIQKQSEDEKPITTKFGESIPGTHIDDNSRGGYESLKDHFQTTPENTESGKAWKQNLSEGGDRAKESIEEFGVDNGTNLPRKPVEEPFHCPEGSANVNVKTTPEEAQLGKSWGERASQGLGFAKEKLQGYGVLTGMKSAQKPVQESQLPQENSQDKFSAIGEGKEIGYDMRFSDSTEDIKTDSSETGPGYLKEDSMQDEDLKTGFSYDQIPVEESQLSPENSQDKFSATGEGKEIGSDMRSSDSTEEIKTGPSETGPVHLKEDFMQDEDLKTGFSYDQKPEESQLSPGNSRDKFSTIGEGKIIGSDMRSSDSTEEIKTGPSETGPGYLKEDSMQGENLKTGFSYDQKPVVESQISPGNSQDKFSAIGEGKEIGSYMRSSDSTAEVKTGPSETGPRYLKEASVLVSPFDQNSSNDKTKDTVMEGACEQYENEGTQQQLSEEQNAGQSFATKIHAVKDLVSSKLGYGGQTNQEPNLMGETKADDQIQTKEMDIDKESPVHTEEIKADSTDTSSGYMKQASKLADELKKVLSFDETSSNNTAKDTMIEEERKENESDGKAGQSYVSKIYAAKDVVSSKLGYGGQGNLEHNAMAESKPAEKVQGSVTESMEGAKGQKTLKSTIVSKLSPGEDDKALSDVITGAVSDTAKSLKDSLGGLYGGTGKLSTTDTATTSNPPSTTNSPSGGKGIVDRVTGVVGSIFGSKQGNNSEQHPAPEKSEPKSQVQVEEQVPEVQKY